MVDHYKVQRESREAFHVATFQVQRRPRQRAVSSHSISLGGALVRNDVNAVLDGEGVDCILNGLYLATAGSTSTTTCGSSTPSRTAPATSCTRACSTAGAGVFNGLIHVHKGAQKTDAKQSNRNLLLSRDAIANTNPQLEIYADDVKCTHGSTVGQLDEDAVFYLRSRGIGEEAARSLLTYAFASDIVERIKVEPVRHGPRGVPLRPPAAGRGRPAGGLRRP